MTKENEDRKVPSWAWNAAVWISRAILGSAIVAGYNDHETLRDLAKWKEEILPVEQEFQSKQLQGQIVNVDERSRNNQATLMMMQMELTNLQIAIARLEARR